MVNTVNGINGGADSAMDPLAQLRDIHLPQPIGWWPVSWGWIVLVVLLLIILGVGVSYLRRRIRLARPRREGLRLLMSYEKEYQQGMSSPLVCARISELLRRVALSYFPREDIAGLQGEMWIDFLNKTGKGVIFDEVKVCLLTLPYQSQNSMPLNQLFVCANTWIKQRK